jgi:hypothetical protein
VLGGEATNTNVVVSGMTTPWLEPTLKAKHASHYTTAAVTFFYVYYTFLYGHPT